MAYFVYIIQSRSDSSFYIGCTADLQARLNEHNFGKTRYTSRKKPWVLVYSEAFLSKHDALVRERFLKKQKNREFYQKLIESGG